MLPHAGGSAGYYRRLAVAVSAYAPDIEVEVVQYPGRQDRYREEPMSDLRALAGHVAAAVGAPSRAGADRPTALFGHSMGAVVAFEVTRVLERAGMPPVRLFASAGRGPGTHRRDRVHRLDEPRLLTEILALGGTDRRVFADGELRAMYLSAVRGDYRALESYECPPDATVGCPVTALVGDRDPRVSSDDARLWRTFTSAGFELRLFPGGHFYLDEWCTEVAGIVRDTFTGSPRQQPQAPAPRRAPEAGVRWA